MELSEIPIIIYVVLEGIIKWISRHIFAFLIICALFWLSRKGNRDILVYTIREITSANSVILSDTGTEIQRVKLLESYKSPQVPDDIVKDLRDSLQQIHNFKPSEKQYLLLDKYYNQGLAQSATSFRFSLIAACLGFIVIVFSLARIDSGVNDANKLGAYIGLISGTIIDVVSALFFVETNRSRKLMTDFFEKLRADRKLDESLQLIEKISDENIQSRVKAIMTLNFAGIKIDDHKLLGNLLGSSTDNFMELSDSKISSENISNSKNG